MSSLVGVALVVDDISKGCNLAFRYPAPPAASSTEPAAASFYKLTPALFAKLFRPKNALCNQSFELIIDDLRFVSHPVLVTSRGATTTTTASSSSSSATAGMNAHTITTLPTTATASGLVSGPPQTSTTATLAMTAGAASAASFSGAPAPVATAAGRNETTMFSVVFALEDLSALEHEDEELAARRRRSIAAFRTVAAQLANGLLHEELRAGFVSREVRELIAIRDELAQNERLVSAAGGGGAGGGAGGGGGSGGTSTSGGLGASGAVGGLRKTDGGGSESGGAGVDVDPQTFIDVALGKSVLANDLKSVFHGLDESGTAHVVLNRWVKLSLTLTDSVAVQLPSLRPYHSLLLLADESKILGALPADHSQQLRLLIEAANPLRSFQDLALETSIPIHQVFRLSAHLVYWGFGKVVDTVTLRNIYQVHPQANLRSHSTLALEFRRKFAPHELSEVLSSFSGSRAISEHMKNLSALKKTEYIHMLIWLLQQNFIIQLHRYVYFMIPTEGDHAADDALESASSFENNSFGSNQLHHPSSRTASFLGGLSAQTSRGDAGDTFSLQSFMTAKSATRSQLSHAQPPSNERRPAPAPAPPAKTPEANPFALSELEREYLDRIATTNPVYTLFKRLCVYFHGQYHLEEIMWRENVSRSELRTVLSTYQDIIVCCLHA